MIFEIPQEGQWVWISAFNAKPQNIEQLLRIAVEKHPTVGVQIVDLDKVPGRRFLTLATINAFKSFHSKPIAKTLPMELLLYISGQKQITEALGRIGVTPQTRRVAALAVGDSDEQVSAVAKFLADILGQGYDDQLLDDWPQTRTENVRSGYDIGDKELMAVVQEKEPLTRAMERLAVERSAMLAARK